MNSKDRFDRKEIMAIPSPAYTKTWSPISHKEVINSLAEVLKKKDIGVRQESYSVKNEGRNIFGTWTQDIEKNGRLIQIGFRNSIMKNFAVGICGGICVMVCSNMQFRGDSFIEFRKHTSGITYDELLEIGDRAIDKVIDQGNALIKWQDGLNKYRLDDEKLKCITYDALDQEILPPNRFKAFQEAYSDELELTKSKHGTLYTFHGAITRMSRELNLFTVMDRTTDLYGLCNKYAA